MVKRLKSGNELTRDEAIEMVIDKVCESYSKGKISMKELHEHLDVALSGEVPWGYADPRLVTYRTI